MGQVSRQAVGRITLRAHMVLLAGRGYRELRIAAIHDCGENVVRHWLHRYRLPTYAAHDENPVERRLSFFCPRA